MFLEVGISLLFRTIAMSKRFQFELRLILLNNLSIKIAKLFSQICNCINQQTNFDLVCISNTGSIYSRQLASQFLFSLNFDFCCGLNADFFSVH